MAIAVPRETTDSYGGLVNPGESLDEAMRRMEGRRDYVRVLSTQDAQRLVEDAGRDPGRRRAVDDLVCVGANHVPGCEHIASSKNLQPLERLPAQLVEIPLEAIDVGSNVRTEPGELELLASSIRDHGVIQPVKAVEIAPGRYRLVWGQRRVLASKLAGRTTIPAVVEMEPDPALSEPGARRSIEQLIENIQRADLNDLDEAKALREVLKADPALSQAELARRLGRDPSWVSNTLVVLEVGEPVQQLVAEGKLTGAHVKALRGLAPKTQTELARKAAEEHASARTVEGMVQQHKRNEEWRQEQQARSAKEHKDSVAKIEVALERVAKKVPKDGRIHLSQYGNDSQIELVQKALEKAGYTDIRRGSGNGWLGARKDSADCNCTAWKIEVGYYGGLSLTAACIVRAHYDAKRSADHRVWTEANQLEGRVRSKLAEILVDQVAELPSLAARIALWIALGWQIDEWTKAQDARLLNVLDASKPKRKKRDPWATITETDDATVRSELARALATHFRDGNFKVGWAGLAEQLGVLEAPSAEPKPKHPLRRATATDAG